MIHVPPSTYACVYAHGPKMFVTHQHIAMNWGASQLNGRKAQTVRYKYESAPVMKLPADSKKGSTIPIEAVSPSRSALPANATTMAPPPTAQPALLSECALSDPTPDQTLAPTPDPMSDPASDTVNHQDPKQVVTMSIDLKNRFIKSFVKHAIQVIG